MQALPTGEEVLAGDLAACGWCARWPVLVSGLVALGVRAVLAISLVMGRVTVGVLQMYRGASARWLSAEEIGDGYVFANHVLGLLVGAADEPRDYGVDAVLAGGLARQWARVYQAVGVVSAQLDTGLVPAFARLRAYAFVADRPLREVTDTALDDRLRFIW